MIFLDKKIPFTLLSCVKGLRGFFIVPRGLEWGDVAHGASDDGRGAGVHADAARTGLLDGLPDHVVRRDLHRRRMDGTHKQTLLEESFLLWAIIP